MKPNSKLLTDGILFTDFYQFTMAQLYFKAGIHERPAQFDYFFRHYPVYDDESKAGYCINAGLEWLLLWMTSARFHEQELSLLKSHKSRSGKLLFCPEFLNWLQTNGSFEGLNLQAIPEGRIVHPLEPLVTVRGPLIMAQILESSLLNHLNYQTLIATKAARIKDAGGGKLLLEFGLRRGQGDGANAGTRAALIGGADLTSNTGLSYTLGLPPSGTHAHSMVQAFLALQGSELDAFRAYAEVYPDDCLLLVDTVDTLNSGLPNAIKVFEELRRKGHKPIGVRLDSGDLAYLSVQAAKMLNAAGFPDTSIVLSNQLDELVLWTIITQIRREAATQGIAPESVINRLVYGVGTRLITSRGQGALDGVYKLTAIQSADGWQPAIKLSDTPEKVVIPGHKAVWRIYDTRGKASADYVCLAEEDPRTVQELFLQHPVQAETYRRLNRQSMVSRLEPLLTDVYNQGKLIVPLPTLDEIRLRRIHDLQYLDSGVKRLMNPHRYHVSLSRRLWELKESLITAYTVRPG
jgi:nicotinate phosphoribosyltransferase